MEQKKAVSTSCTHGLQVIPHQNLSFLIRVGTRSPFCRCDNTSTSTNTHGNSQEPATYERVPSKRMDLDQPHTKVVSKIRKGCTFVKRKVRRDLCHAYPHHSATEQRQGILCFPDLLYHNYARSHTRDSIRDRPRRYLAPATDLLQKHQFPHRPILTSNHSAQIRTVGQVTAGCVPSVPCCSVGPGVLERVHQCPN